MLKDVKSVEAMDGIQYNSNRIICYMIITKGQRRNSLMLPIMFNCYEANDDDHLGCNSVIFLFSLTQ